MQVRKRFNKLKKIFNQNQITPIFITQVEYDGLKDNKLYFVNELIKQLAEENNFYIIKLDEMIVMRDGDFYDKYSHHSTRFRKDHGNDLSSFKKSNFGETK